MRTYLLELIVFLSGAAVMVLELVGSRILAPYVGTSLSVWTSLIGIILASLSLGYWWGGKAADRNPSLRMLSAILLFAALFVGATAVAKDLVLSVIQLLIRDIRISSIINTLILFAPASVAFGMVTPYAVRLKIQTVAASGKTVGNLYAVSTIGSIVGTFTAGFILIPALGSANILLVTALGLIGLSFLTYAKSYRIFKAGIAIFLMVFGGFTASTRANRAATGFIDTDTRYNRVLIEERVDIASGRPVRTLRTDGLGTQSAMFLDGDGLVFEYTKLYNLALQFVPRMERTLMLGGGAYSYPKYFVKRFPEATIDVVEIDPKLTELARRYFNLTDDPRLRIFHEDGRTFLNRFREAYDAIFVDAFNTYSPPFQLTTRETAQDMFARLKDGGVVIMNIISAIEGPKGRFLRAEYATYRSVFPYVYVIPVTRPSEGGMVQNVMLVAVKSASEPNIRSSDPELASYLSRRWIPAIPDDMPVLTDERAPVEFYTSNLF